MNGFSRPDTDTYFVQMAKLVAQRATCARRRVGCVLTDINNHVLATGYNGVARGRPHCIDQKCPGADCPSGTGLDLCEAIHAENNALLQCKDVDFVHTCYVVSSPCKQCIRLLLNTRCTRIVFEEEYPHSESRDLWLSAGREWIKWESPTPLPTVGINGELMIRPEQAEHFRRILLYGANGTSASDFNDR